MNLAMLALIGGGYLLLARNPTLFHGGTSPPVTYRPASQPVYQGSPLPTSEWTPWMPVIGQGLTSLTSLVSQAIAESQPVAAEPVLPAESSFMDAWLMPQS